MFSRRQFLGAFGAAYLHAAPAGLSVGFHLKEVHGDLRAILREIAAAGYREVELAGLRERRPADLRQLLNEAGLVCKSAHWTLWEDQSEIEATLDAATELGVDYLVTSLPSLMGKDWFQANESPAGRRGVWEKMTVNDWRWNADWFNHVGGLVQKYNMQFVYRNHNFEFRKHASGIEFDELLQRTEPSRVMLEFDCGWAAIAGYDPVAFLKRHGDRVAMLHLSEPPRGFTSSTGPGAPEPEAPLGNGTIDWPAVLNAAKAAGVRRSFVDAPPARMRAAYKFLVG